MKLLYYKPFKGLQIRCTKCKKTIHKNSKPHKGCNHPLDKQIYKAVVIIPNSGGERKTKTLKSKEYDEAIVELLEFKRNINLRIKIPQKDTKPTLLNECMIMYLDYKQDINVPTHLKKFNNKEYVKNIHLFLKKFKDFLLSNGYDLEQIKVKEINDDIIGLYTDYLIDKDYKNATYNHCIKTLRYFYNFLIEIKDYEIKNPFKKVKLKSVRSTNSSINKEDFFDLLKNISNKNSIMKIGEKHKKNMYREWLEHYYKLKLYTGLRDYDITHLKWNMIKYKDNKPILLEVPEHKTNQRNNNIKERDFEYVYVPIGEELFNLLVELNLLKNINANSFIIEPALLEEKNRKQLEKQASKSFSFFFNKLNKSYHHTLKDLRKTYTTAQSKFFSKGISIQHSNYKTTEKYYNDNKEIAIYMAKQGFRIFEKTTPLNNTPQKTKDLQSLESLVNIGGEYRNRTDDLLTASQTL